MITSRFPLGDVSFSAEYFSTLVGEATKQCYGVAAMTPRDLTDVVKSVVRGNDYSEKGVRVTQEEGDVYKRQALTCPIRTAPTAAPGCWWTATTSPLRPSWASTATRSLIST